MKFNEIKSRNELANFLGISIRKLTYILYSKKTESCYTSFDIPKKNGGVRNINAPTEDLKHIQVKLANALWEYKKSIIKEKNINVKISHAFEKRKSIITNAQIHRKKRFIFNIDLENFFNSIHFGRIRGYFEKNENFKFPIEIATIIAQLTCYNHCLPQGAPSSPIITNFICNILDMKLLKIARKYKMDYTRYADDMTFSTNDNNFLNEISTFYAEIEEKINQNGFTINGNKTRLAFQNSRQTVTGLVVNNKISIPREYYKLTRAMIYSLYKNGEFTANGVNSTIRQLEGRLAFINQIDLYNNRITDGPHSMRTLNSREKQYQKFLFYKYFFIPQKPLIVTEGKTDIVYLKAALKKYYYKYPDLITKIGDKFIFHISFLKRTKRLAYFLNINLDGADTIKNIYNFYTGIDSVPNICKWFDEKTNVRRINPVILIFDNEQENNKPLKKFINHMQKSRQNKEIKLENPRYKNIIDNLYLLTNPLMKGKNECEIEDLFNNQTLSHKINGKSFCRNGKFDSEQYYGKEKFSQYIASDYESIDFKNFQEMLNDINITINEYKSANENEEPIKKVCK
ncbi:retron Ec67 family RNA-directed DNA polymerase/endonuclease [Pectinatus frisingensis]|uniref:retron Ec67 family RNA-directed DNA polymerase/endonuclease n=1 Tax=Pectinatus frisingensis TaxID=865 RepID=UPI0018C50654|nr:retron Ec67 family RNA-directed DNA polymerase/endonuclease [Pectinatus frisingensis]